MDEEHKCHRCNFTTKHKHVLKKHLDRKFPCKIINNNDSCMYDKTINIANGMKYSINDTICTCKEYGNGSDTICNDRYTHKRRVGRPGIRTPKRSRQIAENGSRKVQTSGIIVYITYR